MKFRNGQIALVFIFILIALLVLSLMSVDTFLALRGKNRLQNAGDSAALAAARHQGTLLNEIGALNLEHLRAAIENDEKAISNIVQRQKEIALFGPIEALRLANNAAKKNKMPARASFERILRDHVKTIRLVYAGNENSDSEPYPEPFPGAWTDYASAIENVINEGLAVGADNIEFYDASGSHLLLNKNFYHAIAGRNWCWFHFFAMDILNNYRNFQDWQPLSADRKNAIGNSEIFSLHVSPREFAFRSLFTDEEIITIFKRYLDLDLTIEDLDNATLLSDKSQIWFFFDTARWHAWFYGLSLADDESGYKFPLFGEVKREYNVRGAAAICRCENDVENTANETEHELVWAAAAKPFGTVENFDGEVDVVSALNQFIVPSFTDVRLVALDSVGGSDLSTADEAWVNHTRYHLQKYLERGPTFVKSDCYYCVQLKSWERESLRESARIWLKYNSDTCVRPGGGGGSSGGTPHGH